jgi:hypothetical protein
MRKKLQKKAVTLATSLVKHIRLNTILPFQERPSVDSVPAVKEEPAADDKQRPLVAADLFSLFTADIIKEEVIFTR